MNLKSFFMKAGAGFLIRKFAPMITSRIGFLFDYAKPFFQRIRGLVSWVEEKTGIDLFSPELQAKYESIVDHCIEFTESIFTDQAKIRFLLNKILRGEASLKPEDLKDYAGKTWQEFLTTLPADLKEVLSMQKEEFAAKMIADMMKRLTGEDVSEEKVRASIKAVVSAKNANDAKTAEVFVEESFSALWSRLTRESKERQEKLNG